jgi:hypothetical protein
MNNSSESLHILFQHGAQPTQANSSALLPLHVAASQDSVECVQLITRHFPHVKKLRGGRQQLNAQQIALFVVGDSAQGRPHELVLVNLQTGQRKLLTQAPGRQLGRTLDGQRISFVDKSDPKRWMLRAR